MPLHFYKNPIIVPNWKKSKEDFYEKGKTKKSIQGLFCSKLLQRQHATQAEWPCLAPFLGEPPSASQHLSVKPPQPWTVWACVLHLNCCVHPSVRCVPKNNCFFTLRHFLLQRLHWNTLLSVSQGKPAHTLLQKQQICLALFMPSKMLYFYLIFP